jgi:hypothetical protein
MGKGKAQKKGSTNLNQTQGADDSPAGQLKQLQAHFLRFKDAPAKKRAKVWGLFEEHIKKHGETPSTRSFKARCLLLERDCGNERDRPHKVAAFRDYMEATYLDAQGPPHSISALCLFAHFLSGEYALHNTDATDSFHGTLADLKNFLEGAVSVAKLHGTAFVDPSLEVMEAPPSLQWEKCDAADPRLQILHRTKWLRGISDEVGKVYDNAVQRHTRRMEPELSAYLRANPNLMNPNGTEAKKVRLLHGVVICCWPKIMTYHPLTAVTKYWMGATIRKCDHTAVLPAGAFAAVAAHCTPSITHRLVPKALHPRQHWHHI